MSDKIFINIAAFCDPELEKTIDDILTTVSDKNSLIFGICMQDTEQAMNKFKYRGNPQFRMIYVPFKDSLGCCWARSRTQGLYRGEKYYLQLDSHHRFIKDWDVVLKEMLLKCDSEKPILTAYVNPYDPEDKDKTYLKKTAPNRMTAKKFWDKKNKVQFVPVNDRECLKYDAPQKSALLSAHFIFTYGSWVKEIPYDPNLYFDGEEDSLAVRSWTHGWDLYYPNKVICFHEYTRKGRTKQWDVDKQWWKKDRVSIDRITKLFKTGSIGKYCLGTVRSLNEYRAFSGIDYVNRTLTELANLGKVVLDYKSVTFAAPEPVKRDKKLWESHESVFKEETVARWGEYKKGKIFCRYDVKETGDNYIVLYDKHRKLWVKLTDVAGYFKTNKPEWNYLSDGGWK